MSCQYEITQQTALPVNQEMPESLTWLQEELSTVISDNLFRPVRIRSGRQLSTVTLNGLPLVNFGANDYLGYAGDSRLVRASAKGACAEGAGAGASPLVSGHSNLHDTCLLYTSPSPRD